MVVVVPDEPALKDVHCPDGHVCVGINGSN